MSKKLLLADDSITIQKVIGITFANEDYELSVVDNGDAALEMARAVRPDLILADVFMPGKNGYELCAAVKKEPALGGVPVLLLTGTFEPFDEKKAEQAGADSWIAKPFESQALIDRVEELLSRPVQAVAENAPGGFGGGNLRRNGDRDHCRGGRGHFPCGGGRYLGRFGCGDFPSRCRFCARRGGAMGNCG